MKPRIMYIEQKTGGSETSIGRVTFSKTGKTIYYKDKAFVRIRKSGIYGNYAGYKREDYDAWTNSGSVGFPEGYIGEYWISGPKKNGRDRLYDCPKIQIDEDVREEYWLTIREKPECVNQVSR